MSPYRIEPNPTADTFPTLTRDQVREVDRLAIHELNIPGVVLMENAGLNATAALLDFLRQQRHLEIPDLQAAVLCGGGNNGGDGYVIARHLHNRGTPVTCYALTDPEELTGDAAVNHRICANMGLPIERVLTESDVPTAADQWRERHVIVDALLGTGFRGAVREPMAAAIEAVNGLAEATVVAVDVPSGLDCNRGEPSVATVRADLTVTFVAAKAGFFTEAALPCLGALAVADIGAPPELIDRVRGE
ncbi:MAG: NAD(P)H-hydrate epimerase [Phycisphaeraceae bacterium]